MHPRLPAARPMRSRRLRAGLALALAAIAASAASAGCGGGDSVRSAPTLKEPERIESGSFARSGDPGSKRGAKPKAGRAGGNAANGDPSAGASDGAGSGSSSRAAAGASSSGGGGRVRPLDAEDRAGIESVKAALRELIARTNARDPGVCTELMTQRHVEEATGLSGPAAVARCRRDVKRSTATVRLNRIHGVRIEGDEGLIAFASSVGEFAKHQVLRVLRVDGRWKFDGDGSAEV